MIYFISDTHFGHKNIISYCNRPFDDIDDMDLTIIKNWNKVATNDDHIYIIGDFMFYATNSPDFYLRQLKGKKHLIIGNHDFSWDFKKYEDLFVEIAEIVRLRYEGKSLILSHYPLASFSEDFQIYGHIHNNIKDIAWKVLKPSQSLNASVEINNYSPVSFEQLQANNKSFYRRFFADEE